MLAGHNCQGGEAGRLGRRRTCLRERRSAGFGSPATHERIVIEATLLKVAVAGRLRDGARSIGTALRRISRRRVAQKVDCLVEVVGRTEPLALQSVVFKESSAVGALALRRLQ